MENRVQQEKDDRFEATLRKVERVSMLVLTGVSVAAAIYCHRKLKFGIRLMNKAAESISDITVVDVQQSMIDRAIDAAVHCKVASAVGRATRMCEDEIIADTRKKVSGAVQQSYGKISKAVTDAIAKEAAKIDQSAIMETATEKAKELLLERFDGKLDGLMTDYQRNLDNVGKIYQSIASSMANKAGKDVTLKLG